MKPKPRTLYLFQRQYMSLATATEEMEKEFAETEREVAKVVHEYHGYATEYAIPAFDDLIRIFPIDQSFVDYLLPEIYTFGNISKKQRHTLDRLMVQLDIGSFLIEVPESLSAQNQEYLIKLLGIALGGYYSKLSDIPSHGILNKRKHIFIKAFRKQGEDIFNQLENLLEKYSS